MKTKHISLLKVATVVTLLGTLLTTAACQGKKAKEQEESTAHAATVTTTPQMDIHTAVVAGNLEVVRQHIAAGSDINVGDPFGGSSPLISASVFGKTEIAKALIDAGANLNAQNNEGSTALHTAAFFCRPEIVKMLLEKGADKTIKNKYGTTAYESVIAPFGDVKPFYDMMVKALGPMGLKLDYTYIEKTRPEIAKLLK
ncbi:MAG: ankyrin repeat domain-containing protein [Bacteroidetes bacterium]|nr:ankyrin repeat domain-containing protein [Bacteroidota bacterium]